MKYTEAEIKPFIDACEDMVRSKFILIDKRISSILKAIATTKPVYNAIAEAMINFNWTASWKSATQKAGELIIPDETSKIVAFVFCLLKNIDSGTININDVLVKYCSNDEDRRSPYTVFCEKTIVPFKALLVSKLVGTKVESKAQEQPKISINTEVNDRLEFLVKDVKAYVVGLKKIKGSIASKQEYLDVLEVFVGAIKSQDTKYYLTFANILSKFSGKDKELNNRINSIIELISHIQE